MEIRTSLLQQSKAFLPLLAALAGVSVTLAVANMILKRRYGDRAQASFRVQLILVLLTLIGLLVIVLALPLEETLH